jgi:hypothetical protein
MKTLFLLILCSLIAPFVQSQDTGEKLMPTGIRTFESAFESGCNARGCACRFYMQLENTGKKTVKIVYWTFVLYDPAHSGRYVNDYTLTSDKKIKPGQKKKLGPIVEDCTLSERFTGAGILTGIDYEDGTSWRRTEPLPFKE